MRPGDVVTCRSCGTTATAYTTGDPARWSEGKALLVSWHGYRHEVGVFQVAPSECLPCAYLEKVRAPPNRRAAICDELAAGGVRLDGAEWRTDAELEDAFQKWIAAGRPSLVLVSVGGAPSSGAVADTPLPRGAGQGALLERPTAAPAGRSPSPAFTYLSTGSPEAQAALDRFMEDARAYRAETGRWPYGYSLGEVPAGDAIDQDVTPWVAWLRKRAAAAPRPPPKPPKGQLSLL